jgi:hypothetical protein
MYNIHVYISPDVVRNSKYRRFEWISTHLRSAKFFLWRRLPDEVFRGLFTCLFNFLIYFILLWRRLPGEVLRGHDYVCVRACGHVLACVCTRHTQAHTHTHTHKHTHTHTGPDGTYLQMTVDMASMFGMLEMAAGRGRNSQKSVP